ncbi:phosphoglycerate dehydrogenase [Mangrovitalea sediminis]|uniref:phosphoglycerate dehydrogenase n=1 Tax=Mangrovitalea sediminis TaxID=1982043 RepID=UPI000BE5EB64|nr:phosphoglycerate dehydrogenase [Mangrovitalea sediminis]
MLRIRTYNNISIKGLDRFGREQYEVASDINRPDAILLRSYRLHDDPIPDSVQAIARAGAGVNNIPVDACTDKGIVVFNTPGANANAVKELVLAGLLLSSRGILPGIAYAESLTATDHTELNRQLEAEKKRFAGREIAGQTLGVVGLGAIGSLVANMALGLGMKVIGYDPALSVDAAWRLSSQVQKAENLQSLLARSDFISLHVPALPETQHLIGTETLSSVREGAVILNFAREEIVDTDAMLTALQAGRIKSYVSDFPSALLRGRPEVIAMPHLGASTAESEQNCAVMAAEQLKDFLENGNIRNAVNFPATSMERISGNRLTLSNHNVPKVLGHVLSILANRNINVIDMVNRSRNNVAYNILDVDNEIDAPLLAEIAEVEHVIRVRAV